MSSGGLVTCIFIVASANHALFAAQRPDLPANGEVISYAGHDYEVLSCEWQEAPPAEPEQDVGEAFYAVARVRLVEGR